MKQPVIDIVTLGCSKNLVDTERLMFLLEAAGYKCEHNPAQPHGETAIINTCGFIGDAKEESINTILAFAQRKKSGLKKLYVMGCLSERYMKELTAEIQEVDGWFGKFDYTGITALLPNLKTANLCPAEDCHRRKLTTPAHYAYLKISEGCNRMCSYCAIPLITGRHTSRPMDEIVEEARWLASQGVKELNVIAQDLSSYGTDLCRRHQLPELVERLAGVEGISWIRLHYAYPTDFPDSLLDVMARHDNVCKYLDIALQHCTDRMLSLMRPPRSTDRMLSLMRRHITRAEQDSLIRRIRDRVPGICLRTTLMVGHPGETDEDFEELLQWVREMRFERMGAFAYSEEEGTYAQRHYKDDIPEQVKQDRLNRLMEVQEQIAYELMQAKTGTQTKVIIDSEDHDYYIGRTEHDSPEVDCEVLIKKDPEKPECKKGEFYNVHITTAEAFDLYATL